MASQATASKPTPPKQEHQVPRSRSGEKVTVACKLPNGVVMQLFKKGEFRMAMPGGHFEVAEQSVPDPDHPPITAVGWRGTDGKLAHGTIGGYGLTPNVPLEFWEKWLEQNKGTQIVVNRLIFAHGSHDHISGQAKEQKALRSGLEPLDMKRETKIVNGKVMSMPLDPRVARETPRVETKTED